MVRLGTDCSECRFYKNNECIHGMIDKFKNNGDNVIETESSHIIDRVCVYRRTPDWRPDVSDAHSLPILKEETYIRGSIILVLKKISDLNKVIPVITDRRNSNFSLIIAYENLKHKDIQVELDKYDIKNKIVFVKLFMDINEPAVLDEAFKWAKNGFVFFIDSELPIDENMIDKINHAVNEKMHRVMCVKSLTGEYHQLVCFSIMYAHLKGNKFTDSSVRFVDKLEAFPNSNVYTWDEINYAYTN